MFVTLAAFLLVSSLAAGSRQIATTAGFPAGQGSPEGVACDLARAFAQEDAAAFRAISFRPTSATDAAKRYRNDLDRIGADIQAGRSSNNTRKDSPEFIERCFRARSLSHDGPASYAYAVFNLKDVKFVDVVVRLRNGNRAAIRTLVVQNIDDKWYVVPVPDALPMLSYGMAAESPSRIIFPREADAAAENLDGSGVQLASA